MKSKKNLIILTLVVAISLIGVTYAFFQYYRLGSNQKIIAGAVNLILNDGTTTINRSNIFPESKVEARSRNDNAITFTVSGINTTEDEDIWYEIMLNEGDPEEGMTRFNAKDLVFDLIELDDKGNEVAYLVDAMSFSDFNARRIWVDTITKGTDLTKTRTYKLRMWLSKNVLISDSDPSADYPADGYENYYASVKVSVYGDFVEKSVPYNYLIDSPWRDGDIYNQKVNITEIHFVSMEQSEIDRRFDSSTMKKDVTDTSKGGSVKSWLEEDTADETKYIMYVASDGTTFFPSSCLAMLKDFISAKSIVFNNVDTRFVTTMRGMFISCSSLTSLEIDGWDTSGVSDMAMMFDSCSGLTSLDIDSWDTSSVSDMSQMFSGCASLTSLEIGNWDTSSVTHMSNMFRSCENLISLEIGNWDTSSVIDMSKMFNSCENLISLEIGKWDTSSVSNMYGMFDYCINLISLDLNNWDTSSVSNISYMFSECASLTSLEIGNWDTSSVSKMSNTFNYCMSLTSLDLNNWDTSSVSDMQAMFYECSNLTSLDIGNFTFDGVTSYGSIFSGMKARTDNTPTIIVKDATAQNWILTITGGYRPSSWTVDNVVLKTSVQG